MVFWRRIALLQTLLKILCCRLSGLWTVWWTAWVLVLPPIGVVKLLNRTRKTERCLWFLTLARVGWKVWLNLCVLTLTVLAMEWASFQSLITRKYDLMENGSRVLEELHPVLDLWSRCTNVLKAILTLFVSVACNAFPRLGKSSMRMTSPNGERTRWR